MKHRYRLLIALLIVGALALMAVVFGFQRATRNPCPGPDGSNADVYSCRQR